MTGIVGIGYPFIATVTCLMIFVGRIAYVFFRRAESSTVKSHAIGAAIAFAGIILGCVLQMILFQLTVNYLINPKEYVPLFEPKPEFEDLGNVVYKSSKNAWVYLI